MWKVISAIIMAIAVLGASLPVDARGGRSSDDCKPGTKDPDCQ